MDFDFDFEDIARDFKMIEGNDYSVIVNYNDDAEGRINELVYGYYTRGKLRSLQKYTVSLNVQEYSRLRDIDAVEGLGEKIGLLISKKIILMRLE